MTKSTTEITALVGNAPAIEYRDLLEYSIDSHVLTLADAFELKFANPSGAHIVPKKGDPVSIYASDPAVAGGARALIMKGLVVEIDYESDDQGGTVVTVSGADLGWHIVNNCGPLFLSTMNSTFQAFLDSSIDPTWGFSGIRSDNDLNRRLNQGRATIAPARSSVDVFIPPVCFEAGEMIADKLITYARRAKQLVNVSADGYLQFFRPRNDTPVVGTLHYHKPSEVTRKLNNVKSPVRIHESIEGVYTDVICVGTVAVPSVMPDRFNPHAGTFQGRYQDTTQLPFRRYRTLSDSDAMVQSFANDRARWAFARGLFDSWVGQYTVFGHVLGGTLLAADTMIAVDDTINGVRENLYVAGRRFQRSKSGGTTTRLELRKPNLLRA
jgi:prophage tail gpP-like protein